MASAGNSPKDQKHERRVVGHASGRQEQMNTCVCGKPWPCPEALPSKQCDTGYPMAVEEAIRRIRLKLEVRKQNLWSLGQVCWVEIGEVETLIQWIEDRRAHETGVSPDCRALLELVCREWVNGRRVLDGIS